MQSTLQSKLGNPNPKGSCTVLLELKQNVCSTCVYRLEAAQAQAEEEEEAGGRKGIYVAEELYRWTPAGGAASQYERQNCNTLNRRNCKSVTLLESPFSGILTLDFGLNLFIYDVTALGWTIKGITDHAIPLPRSPLLNKLNTFSDTFFLSRHPFIPFNKKVHRPPRSMPFFQVQSFTVSHHRMLSEPDAGIERCINVW